MFRAARLILIVAIAALSVGMLAFIGWSALGGRVRVFTDADTIRTPADGAPVRDILWQPARRAPDPINSNADDYEPRLSADGLTLYFVRGKPGGGADLYTARRTPDGWTEPAPLGAINDPGADDLGPEPSPDGRSLYFYSDRAGGLGGYDLWVARRSSDGSWLAPVNLGPAVNS
ncbi:MAG: hypothetical protein D6693_02010, partial [Planctomycetota bacterium]